MVTNVNEYYPIKKVLNTLYGEMRARGGYVVKRGARGSGRLYHLTKVQGYEKMVAQLIRLQLRYPNDPLIALYRNRLLYIKDILYGVDVNSQYPSIYVDSDAVTRYNGL